MDDITHPDPLVRVHFVIAGSFDPDEITKVWRDSDPLAASRRACLGRARRPLTCSVALDGR